MSPGERYGFVYEINYLRCIHCDMCVEACPTEAITETKLFEFSFTNRADAIYTKDELLVDDDGRPQQLPWEDWRPGRRPAHLGLDAGHLARRGSPPTRGSVQWSGELGYGVRAPEGGQSGNRDDAATGIRAAARDVLARTSTTSTGSPTSRGCGASPTGCGPAWSSACRPRCGPASTAWRRVGPPLRRPRVGREPHQQSET